MDEVVRGDGEGRARRAERNARAERHATAIRAMRLLQVYEAAPTPEASASGHVTLTPTATPLDAGRSSAAALAAVAAWFAETGTVPRPTGRKGMLPAMRTPGGKPFGKAPKAEDPERVVLLARRGARVWLDRDGDGSPWRGFVGRGASATVDAVTLASTLGVAMDDLDQVGTLPPAGPSDEGATTTVLVGEGPTTGQRRDEVDHEGTPRLFDGDELGALAREAVLDARTEAALRRLGWLRDPAFVPPVRSRDADAAPTPDPWDDAPAAILEMVEATPDDEPEDVVTLALVALIAGTDARLRDALATDATRFVDGDGTRGDVAPFVTVGVGKSARTKACQPWLTAILRTVAPEDRAWDARPLFQSPSGGSTMPMTRAEARRAMDRLGRRVGMRITPSSLREMGRAARSEA